MSVIEIVARLAGAVSPGGPGVVSGDRGDAGASLVEYTLLLMLVVIASFVAMQFVGGATAHSLNDSGSRLFAP